MLASGLVFRLRVYRFHFTATESVYFPPGKAGNVLRGALGTVHSVIDGARPSGLAHPPGAFVLRAAHLDGMRLTVGEDFHFDLNVFLPDARLIDTLNGRMTEWASTGLGPRRGRADLRRSDYREVRIPLTTGAPISNCSLLFRTPTDLKGNSSRDEIPFGVLFARVRDRVATLSSLYGEGVPAVDYQAMGERAAAVRTVSSNLIYQEVFRRSSRTGAVHSIGGIVGDTAYAGDLTEFHPWLCAAQWTGIGRHTVWGNGALEILHAE